MEAKLIKENDGYTLYVDGKIIGSTEGHPLKSLTNKLSIKNCQVIERGYDLDELAYDYSWNHQSDPKWGGTIDIFKDGFQKALELMGDKKFSEEQVLNAFYAGWISKDKLYPEAQKSYKGYLKRHVTQQTEWDVEIEMDILNEYDKPKLDADRCLILKRI